MISEKEFLAKLAQQKKPLELAMYKASYYWYNDHNKSLPNYQYEIARANLETFQLGKGADLCYDRPSIGFVYNLYYQPRRINAFLKYFARTFYNLANQKEPIDIYDLGAGAGAIQCAVGLAYHILAVSGASLPPIRMINIDTSPFMLNFNLKYLWTQFCSHFPHAKKIKTDYSLNSWSIHDESPQGIPWFIASYLFDQSENIARLQANFLRLASQYKPERVFLLSSFNKRGLLNGVCTQLKQQSQYEQITPEFTQNLLFSGPVESFSPFRNWLCNNIHPSFNSTAYWDEKSLYASILEKRSLLSLPFGQKKIEKISLFSPPKISRAQISLNDDQRKAAVNDGRPTIITGPAGSGKTVVITERIKNIVESVNYNSNLRILFSTFNKGLINFVHHWLKDLLDEDKFDVFIQKEAVSFVFHGSHEANIWLLNFDKIPTRIGNINDTILEVKDSFHYQIFNNQVIPNVYEKFNLDNKRMVNILTPEFLYEEYHRVVYGLSLDTIESGEKDKEIYLNCMRRGRGFGLNKEQRDIVWYAISLYLGILNNSKYDSLITRRHRFLRNLRSGQIQKKFDHIYVDEFQDCTPADIDTFYLMLNNPDHLVISGDVAQAVHLGKTATSRIPRLDGMKKRNVQRLKGSYRLPFRISEAIQPFSEYVHNLMDNEPDILEPYRDAPPGSRPIVVYATSNEEMAQKVQTIVNHYKIFYQPQEEGMIDKTSYLITILEWDMDLYHAVNNLAELGQQIATTNSILALKGLEKNCVVWSTKSRIGSDEDQFQFIYTILTRTTSLLIVALFDNISMSCKEAISKFREDRLIFWDQASENQYKKVLVK